MDSWDFKYHASVFLSHVLVSCLSYHNIIFCLFFKTCKITSRYRRFLAIHKTNLLTKQTKSTLMGEREMDRYIGCFLEKGASSVFHTCNMTSLVASPPLWFCQLAHYLASGQILDVSFKVCEFWTWKHKNEHGYCIILTFDIKSGVFCWNHVIIISCLDSVWGGYILMYEASICEIVKLLSIKSDS